MGFDIAVMDPLHRALEAVELAGLSFLIIPQNSLGSCLDWARPSKKASRIFRTTELR